MKIAASSMDMLASHRSQATRTVEERLAAWVGRRPDAPGEGRSPRGVVVSEAARQVLSQEQAQATSAVGKPDDDDGTKNDPKLALLKSIIEQLTGQRIHLMSADELSDTPVSTAAPAAQAQAPAPEFGIAYDRTETRTESEESHFSASGTIQTVDGKRIDFSVALSMSRSETTTSSLSLRAGNAVSKDPLVINFDGEAASLSSQRFSFDLMGDGQQVDMPLLGQGSGFLVLDAVDSGQVMSGRQLFGPASGDWLYRSGQVRRRCQRLDRRGRRSVRPPRGVDARRQRRWQRTFPARGRRRGALPRPHGDPVHPEGEYRAGGHPQHRGVCRRGRPRRDDAAGRCERLRAALTRLPGRRSWP